MAPRSSDQFRIGPPFGETKVVHPIVDDSGNLVIPEISARIDRGFEMIDGEWIGYKRNYFSLVASFKFANRPLDICSTSKFLYLDGSSKLGLSSFKIRLRHTCLSQENFCPTLVQLTPKRDSGPHYEPPKYPIVCGELPPHEIMQKLANISNRIKVSLYDRFFYLLEATRKKYAVCPGILSTYPKETRVAIAGRYERIQFRTTKNGKMRGTSASLNLSFLHVELVGIGANESEVVLASSTTTPLTIRGRSPALCTTFSVKENDEMRNTEKEAMGNNRKRRKRSSGNTQALKRNHLLENKASVQKSERKTRKTELKLSSRTCQSSSSPQKISKGAGGRSHTHSTRGVQGSSFSESLHLPSNDLVKHLLLTKRVTRSYIAKMRRGSHTPKAKPFSDKHAYVENDLPSKCNEKFTVTPAEESLLRDTNKDQKVTNSTDSEVLNEVIEDLQQNTDTFDSQDMSGVDKPVVDPCNLANLAITCPLGCYLIYPPEEYQLFLQTSTPICPAYKDKRLTMCPEVAETLHPQTVWCKHGFKRKIKPKIKEENPSSRSYGSQDFCSENYDSSFTRLRECLDKIKTNIHFMDGNLSPTPVHLESTK